MTDAHITRLEERLAHLTRTAEELSDIVAAQRAEIDRLAARVELLLNREAEREAAAGAFPLGDERPPHW